MENFSTSPKVGLISFVHNFISSSKVMNKVIHSFPHGTTTVLPPKSLSLIFELTLNSPKLIYVLAHLLLPDRKLGSATKYFWQNPVCKLTTYWISTSFPIDNKYRYFSLTGLPRILLNACAYRLTWPWYRSITFWIPCCGLPGSTKSVL